MLRGEGCNFCVSSALEQEDDQQESKKCNEWGTSGVA